MLETFKFKHLVAVLAGFGPHFAAGFMFAKVLLEGFEAAVLALFLDVGFCLVLFLIALGHDLPTHLAFVVEACALDFVHAELGSLDLLVTV